MRRKGTINKGNMYKYSLLKMDNVLNSSKQLDEFNYTYDIIQPPYEPSDLIKLVECNDTIKQNIKAIATNIASFGYGIRFQSEFDYNADENVQSIADNEWETLRKLYKYINPLIDFNALIYKIIIDMYTFGWGMIEVIRNISGDICVMEYCRACNFRIVKNDSAETVVKLWEETEKGYEQIDNRIKFKKFVQVINGKKVYFKEFGDKRNMSFKTGEYRDDIPIEELATEIAYFHIYSSYTDYGIPDWINTSITASGNIMSELLNHKYFDEGRILPMAVTVSGGQLTEESAEAIKNGKGIDNAYKILILEASPFESNEEDKFLQKSNEAKVGIDIKSLTDTNNSDALFRNYQLDGKEKIRDSFRIPPIYTGASSDYNRATADTARKIAEEQIFIPERKRICNVFNKIINNEKGIKYCEVYLKGPEISDTDSKINIINALNAAGAVTPNSLLSIVSELLGKEIEPWNEELGNIPFELIKMKFQSALNDNSNIVKSNEIDEIERLINIINNEDGGSYE